MDTSPEFYHGMMKIIDTEEKAYLLGWVACDGNINEDCIIVKSYDDTILERFRNIISGNIHKLTIFMSTLYIPSTEMSADIVEHLGLRLPCNIRFPTISNKKLYWDFIRGYFDGNGSIGKIDYDTTVCIRVTIGSWSLSILESIKEHAAIPCSITQEDKHFYTIEYLGVNALDFLGNVYDMDDKTLCVSRNYEKFREILLLKGTYCDGFYFTKTDKDAVTPSKPRTTDIGYDLTAITKIKSVGDVDFYGTGIAVSPPMGYYCMIAPRSSISKTGYMLANSMGIVDPGYTNQLIIALRKVDKDAEDIILPCRIAQIIPQRAYYPQLIEVDSLEDTARGGGGFGSS
jgi:deoxyuridine 5'-triphosphate nucleotidohydrolase